MRTTLKDIANKVGVSVTTVSLVINNKPCNIPEKTKLMVLNAVKEMKYTPNQLAVGLIKKRTNTIGLIISDIRNIFFSTLAMGVEESCRKIGWNVILCNTSDNHARDIEYINILASKGVDGILYCMSADSDEKLAKESCDLMKNLNIPYVMVDRTNSTLDCCSVVLDHINGGYIATKYLTDLGHKRIACITGPAQLFDSQQRLSGYIMALTQAGIKYDNDIVFTGNYTISSGYEAVEKIVQKNITAVFCFNDMMAYGVYKGLKERGLKMPEDISVVGYDDVFLSDMFEVPLTSVKQPIYEMGEEATKNLINIIENETSIKREIVFKPEMVIRKSTSELQSV